MSNGYDTAVSARGTNVDPAVVRDAEHLDGEVLGLIRAATGA